MEYNQNKSLYWYGWRAKLKWNIGMWLIILGSVIGAVYMFDNTYLGLFIILVGVISGIYLIMTGNSQRFDYQRQSGSIIHGGDNFGR